MGGRLGIHSCAMLDGSRDPVCNADIAANAAAHGVPWGVIEDFANQTDPSSMLWLGAEKAQCWGLTTSRAHPCRNGSAVGKSNRPTSLKHVPMDERGDRKIPRMSKEPALSLDSGTKPK